MGVGGGSAIKAVDFVPSGNLGGGNQAPSRTRCGKRMEVIFKRGEGVIKLLLGNSVVVKVISGMFVSCVEFFLGAHVRI